MARQLISSEASAAAAAVQKESTAGISHNLRSQLNVIIGFTELLLDECPGPLNQEQRQCLNDIRNSARRLLDMINSLLTS